MIWYILIALFITLLTWLLVGPVLLRLNTDLNRYQFMLPGVIHARVVPSGELFYIRGWIFFIPFRLKLSTLLKGNRGKKPKTEKKRKRRVNKKNGLRMIRSVPGAFKVHRLCLDLDTEDFMLNAWLIPAFSTVNKHRNIRMQVNFEGKLFLDLDLRTRIGSLLWIAIKNR